MKGTDLKMDGANVYRSLDLFCEEIANVGENNHEHFYSCLFRLLQLHREFYRIAVNILLSEDGTTDYLEEYKKNIRMEQKKLIEILRGLKRPESLKERVFRNRRVHAIVGFLEGLVGDVFHDWKIDAETNELFYLPDA